MIAFWIEHPRRYRVLLGGNKNLFMQNETLLFERNYCVELERHINHTLRFSSESKRFVYSIKTTMFTGDIILEIITTVSYIMRKYKQKVPITIEVSKCEFYDKLVYIILESLFYYFYNDLGYDIKIILRPKPNIYTEGISESPLRNMMNTAQFISSFRWNIGRMHYRRLVDRNRQQTPDYLSNIMQEIGAFLVNTGIEDNVAQQMNEVLIELVGNAAEHGNSECLIDIDITDNKYTRIGNNDDTFYGMNVAIMNYSPVLFFDPLRLKLKCDVELPERYEFVKRAREFHMNHLSQEYCEKDFYIISSFQHRISGNVEKNKIGGMGLTCLLKSLEAQADTHLCYMLTGNRIFFFEKDCMNYDENQLIGFNKEGRYLDALPNAELFQTINTFFPGVAYNLNYAFKKELV